MKKLMMVAAATVAAWCSWGAESISVKEVSNHYPWDGKVDCVYTVSGLVNGYLYDGAFQLSVKKDGATIRRVITNALGKVAGTYTNTFDCTALFGAGCYPNGGIAVELVRKLDGVQLWAGGPYFATSNVGAIRPQDAGYCFWWGDTVGYTYDSTEKWCAVDGSVTGFRFSDKNEKITTYGKDVAQLTSGGYIDSKTNLVAQYDAAVKHWGSPWRLMTIAEINALLDNCTATWTNNWNGTGINGRVVTGKTTGYTDKSIFLPAGGYAYDDRHSAIGIWGSIWSSAPEPSISANAIYCAATSNNFTRAMAGRNQGLPIRPVRSAE